MIKFKLKIKTKSEILIQQQNYVRSGPKAWKEDDERLRGAAIHVLMCYSSS